MQRITLPARVFGFHSSNCVEKHAQIENFNMLESNNVFYYVHIISVLRLRFYVYLVRLLIFDKILFLFDSTNRTFQA